MTYSDKELLEALEKWRTSVSEKNKKKNSRQEASSIKNTLKSIKKEIRKQNKNSSTDWNEIWNKIVGEEIRGMTRVKRWNNGFLEVVVENPTLRSELDAFFKESLIQSIKEVIDDKKILRGIKFISN